LEDGQPPHSVRYRECNSIIFKFLYYTFRFACSAQNDEMCSLAAHAHSHPPAAAVVVGGDHAGGEVLLVVLVDVENGLVTLNLSHPAAVAVVDEAGGGVAAQGHR